MGNRFQHIKRDKTVEEFIDSADEPKVNKKSRLMKNSNTVLLSISSRMKREGEAKKPVLLYLNKDISSDLDKYCHGNKQAILNYLLRRGIDSIVRDGELILM